MAYYFMAEAKKGQYQEIEIDKSIYFPAIKRKYSKKSAYTLEEIDRFTMMFNNEIELRERLTQEGTLPLEFFEKNLSIRLFRNGKYTKVPYDFLYQKDLEYVCNPIKLIRTVQNRFYQNDFVFIRQLANAFSKTHECSTTAPEVARLSEASIYQNSRHQGLNEIDKNGDNMVTRLLRLIIFKHYENENGKIDYKNEINYRNLHVLIAFINNYDKKLTTAKKEVQEETNLPKQNIKKKTKKKNEVEGQISLFDV